MEKVAQSIPSWVKRSEQGFDLSLLAEMKTDSINRKRGDLTGYECKKCLDKGFIMCYRDDGSLYSIECSCMKIRKCVWKMEKSGLKNIISRFPFDTFTTPERWQQDMKQKAVGFAKSSSGWLVMCGQSGCGKTHLCVSVCRELLLGGKQVIYMPWVTDSQELKSLTIDPEERGKRLDTLKYCDVLYIDDLFKCGNVEEVKPTSADVRIAFDILNQRYLDGKPTIISTEFTPEQLLTIDEAIGGRIFEMAGSNAVVVGRDIRKNHRMREALA